jgi:tetratricopeptide (TPR) repeat protein
LGVAQYRNGEWTNAAKSLRKSQRLTKENSGSHLLYLAMALRQLGDKEEALAWFSKANEWIENNNSTSEELIRFRSEAAELLGIDERTPGWAHQNDSETEPQNLNSGP